MAMIKLAVSVTGAKPIRVRTLKAVGLFCSCKQENQAGSSSKVAVILSQGHGKLTIVSSFQTLTACDVHIAFLSSPLFV